MTHTLALFSRELRDKTRLFFVCAVLAVIPFLTTLAPGTRGHRADVLAFVGGFLGIVVGCGIAVTLGGSTLARELAEKRLSFYFTKPLTPAAIWTGKALASLITSLLCFVIIALPSYIASGGGWRMRWLADREPLVVTAIAIVVLFFLSHIGGTIIRSRSAWLAVDVVCIAATMFAVYLIMRPAMLSGSIEAVAVIGGALAAALLIVVAIAPVWQLANGRTDIKRSHAALSRFLWPAVAAVLLLAGAYVAWLVSAKPTDLARIYDIEQSPDGPMAIVSGVTRNRFGMEASFLVDTRSGETKRIPAPAWWGALISKNGQTAAWLQPGIFSPREFELYTRSGDVTRNTGITVNPVTAFVLSDDGTRIANGVRDTITIYELNSGRLLAAARGFDMLARHAMFFVDNDHLRVIEHHRSFVRVLELDVPKRSLQKLGERAIDAPRHHVAVSSDGTRMFILGANVIADARTAATIAPLPATNILHATVLQDGSVAGVTYEKPVVHLRTFSADGQARYDVPVPGAKNLWICGEMEGGKLILAGSGKGMMVFDTQRGVIERTLPDVKGPFPRFSTDPRLPRYAANQKFLAADANGKLSNWEVGRP